MYSRGTFTHLLRDWSVSHIKAADANTGEEIISNKFPCLQNSA